MLLNSRTLNMDEKIIRECMEEMSQEIDDREQYFLNKVSERTKEIINYETKDLERNIRLIQDGLESGNLPMRRCCDLLSVLGKTLERNQKKLMRVVKVVSNGL